MELRYERKFKVPKDQLFSLDAKIACHPAGFHTQFPDRRVNNIYFDTPELKTFYENVLGVPIRAKYRMRWYGQNMQKIQCPIFEIKLKENELGYKLINKGSDIIDGNLSKINQIAKAHFSSTFTLKPSLGNSYLRSYFISADGLFRLTIDRELKYYTVFGALKMPTSYIDDESIIIELKYAEADDHKARDIMRFIPYRQTKSSKYVSGIHATIN